MFSKLVRVLHPERFPTCPLCIVDRFCTRAGFDGLPIKATTSTLSGASSGTSSGRALAAVPASAQSMTFNGTERSREADIWLKRRSAANGWKAQTRSPNRGRGSATRPSSCSLIRCRLRSCNSKSEPPITDGLAKSTRTATG